MDKAFRNVVIVGNGFDLNLGLRTSYSHFLESTEFSNNKLAVHLKKTGLDRWIDIETELATLSQRIKVDANHPYAEAVNWRQRFFHEFKELKSSLVNYINAESGPPHKGSLAWELLSELAAEGACVIDFNYTESVSEIIAPQQDKCRHIQIHGSAKEHNIIFGVQDDAQIDPWHVFLKKSTSPNFFEECWVSDFMKRSKRIVVFGHSLGASDHSQFQDFFRDLRPVESRKIEIYYYGEEGYNQLYSEIDQLTENQIGPFRHSHNFEMKQVPGS